MNQNLCKRLMLLAPLVVVSSGFLNGEDIFWVGYQYGPPQIPPTTASWFHSDQWFNYIVPDQDDVAYFDTLFDPMANGTPTVVYFGDFTVLPDPPGVPTSIHVPGGDALVRLLEVRTGAFTFRFTDDTGAPQGSLTISEGLHVRSNEPLASLTLFRGETVAAYVSLANFVGGSADLILDDATLMTNQAGLFDIGVGGGRGSVYVGGDSLLQSGYTRVGENGGSHGLLEIVGGQARAEVNGMQIGATGTGRVEIRNGATLHSTSGIALANYGGSANGTLVVSGLDTMFQVEQQGLYVGDSGTGNFFVQDGGIATIIDYTVVGNAGYGTMTVQTGGKAYSNSGYLGLQTNSVGDAVVSGIDSLWSLTNSLFVGPSGSASLTVSGFGEVNVAGLLDIGVLGIVDVQDQGIINVGMGDPPMAGTLRVGPGGTLYGSGTIIGDVLIDGGGVGPGNSPGALHVTGNYNQLPGSLLFLEIGGLLAGTEYDQLLVTGDLALAGAVEIFFSNGFLPHVGDTFDLFNAGGNFVAPDMLSFLNAPAGFEYSAGFDSGVFSLTVTAVPEPTTLWLCSISLLVAFHHRSKLRLA